MKKNRHLMRYIIIRLVIALFPFVPVYGQDEVESSVQKFVRERMVFDVQGQHASSKNRTFLAWEADFGINISRRLYVHGLYDELWLLNDKDDMRSYCSASTLGGGMGYRLYVCDRKKVSLDLCLALSQSIGASSLKCTVYDTQLRLRLGGSLFVPTIGVGFKHIHSHTEGLESRNHLYTSIGFGL